MDRPIVFHDNFHLNEKLSKHDTNKASTREEKRKNTNNGRSGEDSQVSQGIECIHRSLRDWKARAGDSAREAKQRAELRAPIAIEERNGSQSERRLILSYAPRTISDNQLISTTLRISLRLIQL